jgi:poly-gamma-glutamate synthesis protein (capsule biosynthesis protein)
MSNQISRHADPVAESREGVMPKFTFTEVAPHKFRVTRAEAVATWMDIAPRLRLIDLPLALRDPATPAAKRATYLQAYAEIRSYLNAYGALHEGFVLDR